MAHFRRLSFPREPSTILSSDQNLGFLEKSTSTEQYVNFPTSWLQKRESLSGPRINLVDIMWDCVSTAVSSCSGQSFSASVSINTRRKKAGYFKLPFTQINQKQGI